MSCENWYVTKHYGNSSYVLTVLQPANLAGCYEERERGWMNLDEDILIVEICMYALLVFLAFVAYRSMHAKSLDFYRLFGFYSLATIAVPLSLRLSPYYVHPGFNKMVGFGIVIHNLAEFFIVFNVWFGAVNTNALPMILYVWAYTIAETFLPLSVLFFVGMFQGAFLDFLLVATFYNVMVYSNQERRTKYLKKRNRSCYLCMGFGAALLHITSILPLFFAFSTLGSYGAITVIFLAPTFILYIWFASADKTAAPNLMRPVGVVGGIYDKKDERVFRLDIDTSGTRDDNRLKVRKHIEMSSNAVNNNINDSGVDTDAENESSELISRKSVSYDPDKIESVDIAFEFNFILLVNKGLLRINKQWAKSRLTKSIIFAFTIDALLAPIVFIAPCYVDLSDIMCNKA